MLHHRWLYTEEHPDPQRAQELARSLRISPLTARLLLQRGVSETGEVDLFLRPRLDGLLDPFLLSGMERGIARILEALEKKESIWIYGDYDVDGSTGTAILLSFFETIGNPVRFYIPHRVNEGYGLSPEAMKKIADEGGKVVITVDNGIAAVDSARAAKELGIDLIITDHHDPQKTLPDAYAVINPKLPGCTYPNKELCGAGLAFKFAWALAQRLPGGGNGKADPKLREFLVDAVGLVAMATIADMTALLGENRILVHHGLKVLGASERPGIRALREVSGIKEENMKVRDIGFGLGPRINAGGRIGQPDLGARLLSTSSVDEAREIAEFLNGQNRERQKIERKMVTEAMLRIEQEIDLESCRSIIIGDEQWHLGVVGIVASRVVNRYHRPTFVISFDEQGQGKGSGRSIPGCHLVRILQECGDLLEAFGGHSQAAGLTLRRDRFEEFRDRFGEAASRILSKEDLVPSIEIHDSVGLADLTMGAILEMEQLAPFGMGNPQPLLASTDLELAGTPKWMGRDGKHLAFHVRQGDRVLRAVAFGAPKEIEEVVRRGNRFSAAYLPRCNRWNGRESVELEIKGIR